MRILLTTCAIGAFATSHSSDPGDPPKFAAPVQLEAGGAVVATEEPGYASPCLHDVDGDGHKDLVVGQFAGGKMKIYRGNEDGEFLAGEWLEAGGEIAEVPGVW